MSRDPGSGDVLSQGRPPGRDAVAGGDGSKGGAVSQTRRRPNASLDAARKGAALWAMDNAHQSQAKSMGIGVCHRTECRMSTTGRRGGNRKKATHVKRYANDDHGIG